MNLPGPRKAWIALVAVLLVVFVFSASFDMVAAAAIKTIVGSQTGTKVDADRIHFNPAGKLSVRNLRVMNPRGFPKGELAEIPSVDASFDTLSFLGASPRVHEVRVHVREVVVVKDKNGKMNVDALKISKGEQAETGKKLSVGKLVLTLDRVVQKDLTGPKPVVEVHELAIKDATYENLPGAAEVVGTVLGQALQSAAIKGALIYGTAAAAGVAFLPVGAAILMVGKDSAESDVRASFPDAMRAAAKTAGALGEIKAEDKKRGYVKAQINGSEVTIDVTKVSIGKSHVKVSARKLLMPQPKSAGGVLYEIMEITG